MDSRDGKGCFRTVGRVEEIGGLSLFNDPVLRSIFVVSALLLLGLLPQVWTAGFSELLHEMWLANALVVGHRRIILFLV